jgi:CheY-like chemotaxis protein
VLTSPPRADNHHPAFTRNSWTWVPTYIIFHLLSVFLDCSSPRAISQPLNRSFRLFRNRRLDVDFDVCTSHDHAVVKLFRSPPPYQLIISGVRLAEFNDFFLLKHHQNLQPFVPFVVTSGALDTESSRRALEEGAFDFIPTPLDPEQTVNTIRLALWHNKLKALTASRDKILERYRLHIDDYPGNRNI